MPTYNSIKTLICATQNRGGGNCFAQVVVLAVYRIYSVLLWLLVMAAAFLYCNKIGLGCLGQCQRTNYPS